MNNIFFGNIDSDLLNGKPRVLYLDDDKSNLMTFRDNFHHQYEIFTATAPFDAHYIIQDHAIQVVITDHQMLTLSGVDFLASVARDFPEVQRILLTDHSDRVTLVEAINKGRVSAVISKPFNTSEIAQVVHEAWIQFKEILEKDVLIKQLRRQNQQFEFMLRQSMLS